MCIDVRPERSGFGASELRCSTRAFRYLYSSMNAPMTSTSVVDLIKSDAADNADRSGKTELDVAIENWAVTTDSELAQTLTHAINALSDTDWREWRALRSAPTRS